MRQREKKKKKQAGWSQVGRKRRGKVRLKGDTRLKVGSLKRREMKKGKEKYHENYFVGKP